LLRQLSRSCRTFWSHFGHDPVVSGHVRSFGSGSSVESYIAAAFQSKLPTDPALSGHAPDIPVMTRSFPVISVHPAPAPEGVEPHHDAAYCIDVRVYEPDRRFSTEFMTILKRQCHKIADSDFNS
jgi:hypothetical protein